MGKACVDVSMWGGFFFFFFLLWGWFMGRVSWEIGVGADYRGVFFLVCGVYGGWRCEWFTWGGFFFFYSFTAEEVGLGWVGGFLLGLVCSVCM